jgi:hypothetical protein
MFAGKQAVLGARTLGARVMSEESRRCLAVATRAGRGGWVRCEERIVVRKCGEGAGRPEVVRAVESWVGVMAILWL